MKGKAVGGVVLDEVDVAGRGIVDHHGREQQLIIDIACGGEAARQDVFSGRRPQIGQGGRQQGQGAEVDAGQRGCGEGGTGGALVELDVGAAAIRHGGDGERLKRAAADEAERAAVEGHGGRGERCAAGSRGAHGAATGAGQKGGRARRGGEGHRRAANGQRGNRVRQGSRHWGVELKGTLAGLRQAEGTLSDLVDTQSQARGHINTAGGGGKDDLAAGVEAGGRLEHTTAQAEIGRPGNVRTGRSKADEGAKSRIAIHLENAVVEENTRAVVAIRAENVRLRIGAGKSQHATALFQEVGAVDAGIAETAGEGDHALDILHGEDAVPHGCRRAVIVDVEILGEGQGIVAAKGLGIVRCTGPDTQRIHNRTVGSKGFGDPAPTGIARAKGEGAGAQRTTDDGGRRSGRTGEIRIRGNLQTLGLQGRTTGKGVPPKTVGHSAETEDASLLVGRGGGTAKRDRTSAADGPLHVEKTALERACGTVDAGDRQRARGNIDAAGDHRRVQRLTHDAARRRE